MADAILSALRAGIRQYYCVVPMVTTKSAVRSSEQIPRDSLATTNHFLCPPNQGGNTVLLRNWGEARQIERFQDGVDIRIYEAWGTVEEKDLIPLRMVIQEDSGSR